MQSVIQPSYIQEELDGISLGQRGAHAYLLRGMRGVGKHFVAKTIAASWLRVKSFSDDNSAMFVLEGRDKAIGIDEIRALQQFLRLKTVGKDEIRRVVIIFEAQYMTSEAQNALLKTLEEPPVDTRILLTSSDISALKPTILSRVTAVTLHAASLADALALFGPQGYAKENIEEAHKLSQGMVGLMDAILNASEDHPLVAAIHEAKQLLKMSAYERLTGVDVLIRDKVSLNHLLTASLLIARAGLRQAIQNNQNYDRWQRMVISTYAAQDALVKNANAKLVLTELLVNL